MNIRFNELIDSRETVNKWMERFGVRFGVYKNGIFNEQYLESFPIVTGHTWKRDSDNASQR